MHAKDIVRLFKLLVTLHTLLFSAMMLTSVAPASSNIRSAVFVLPLITNVVVSSSSESSDSLVIDVQLSLYRYMMEFMCTV